MSEKTEANKVIEWLKQDIMEYKKLILEYADKHEKDAMVRVVNSVSERIGKLDKPEVLSQEWLDKHLFSLGDEYLWKEAVPVDDLQNLLVPKQEEVTEEQAWKAIHGKYGDEVLQNNIDYVKSQGYQVAKKTYCSTICR